MELLPEYVADGVQDKNEVARPSDIAHQRHL
jgi:hypothetical protein